jgi:hypothetical protein
LSLFRTESEDPVEVAHGTEAELADGTEVWFTRDAFQFIVALQQGAGFPVIIFHQNKLQASVGDPDPQDLHVFGPPGSGFGSISQRCGSGTGSFSFLINVLSELK